MFDVKIWKIVKILLFLIGIGVCFLDFLLINVYVIFLIVYILCIMLIGLFVVMVINLLVIFKCIKCLYYLFNGDVNYFKFVNIGGIVMVLCCVLYYMINFMNMYSIVINRIINLICIVMFYNVGFCILLGFFIEYVFYVFKRRFRGYLLMEVIEL